MYDSLPERYCKVSETVRNYQLLQFGLCTFHYDKSSDWLVAEQYKPLL